MGKSRIASLRHLQTFHTVARLGSVTLAADELHLSQSAISIQIGEMEEAFKTPLVSRTGRGVRLTESGQMLQTYADRMLSLWTETCDAMSTFIGEYSGTLRIGAVTTAEYWLPRLLVCFANGHPRIKVKLRAGKREEIVKGLAAEEFDIAIMGQPPQELAVAVMPFAKNPVGFVAAPSHPLVCARDLSLERLADANLLVRETGSGTRATVERLFREAGLRLRMGSELSSNESIKYMCAAGFGPAYLSLHTCALEIEAGLLALLPLPNNPFDRIWHVVRLAHKPVPQLASAFEHFLCERGETEIRRQFPSLTALNASAPIQVLKESQSFYQSRDSRLLEAATAQTQDPATRPVSRLDGVSSATVVIPIEPRAAALAEAPRATSGFVAK